MRRIFLFISFLLILASAKADDFKATPEVVKAVMFPDQEITKNIEVFNLAGQNKNFLLELRGIDFVHLSEQILMIEPEQSKKIDIKISPIETQPIGIYFGKITVQDNTTIKTIDLLVDIKEKESYFSLSTLINEKNVKDEVIADITIIKSTLLDKAKIKLFTSIKDHENKDIISNSEDLELIEQKTKITRKFNIPDYDAGNYYIYNELTFYNNTAYSIDNFNVLAEPKKETHIKPVYFIILAILILFVIFIIYHKKRDQSEFELLKGINK